MPTKREIRARGREIGFIGSDDEVRFDPSMRLIHYCAVYAAAQRAIERETGMRVDEFLDGMRELLAPVPERRKKTLAGVTGMTMDEAKNVLEGGR